MAGIYIHIPFCHRRCSYCDFYKTTDVSFLPQFGKSLLAEMKNRKDFLKGEPVKTIYFGGGTPSVLPQEEIEIILNHINSLFSVDEKAEITFEANPDDLTPPYVENLSQTPVNRLSIGVQSFFENDLKTMNRRHNQAQAMRSVENAYNAGFKNISIDLIYGLPGLSRDNWKNNLKKAFLLPVDHLSAYHLTYHKGTPFYDWLKRGILSEADEEDSVAQFEMLIDMAAENGFEQYEISNFARSKKYSKHNMSYWFNETYLGLGPSAHSYNGEMRQWNVSNLAKYMQAIKEKQDFSENEILSETDLFNDYIITRLRTKWGITKKEVVSRFGYDKGNYLISKTQPYLQNGYMKMTEGSFVLTRKGLFISDKIMEDIFLIG